MTKRKYTKGRRAEQEEQTHERIVEATVALHEERGPANTSIKAIAEKAGVQRLTVYRHFPDDASLFQACTSHWLKSNSPPDMSEWSQLEKPEERSYTALLAFYQYYRQTEKMWKGAYRDVDDIEALKKPMADFGFYLDQVRDDLLVHWKVRGKNKKQRSITLRHCLQFNTWQALKKENLKDKQIADLVMTWF